MLQQTNSKSKLPCKRQHRNQHNMSQKSVKWQREMMDKQTHCTPLYMFIFRHLKNRNSKNQPPITQLRFVRSFITLNSVFPLLQFVHVNDRLILRIYLFENHLSNLHIAGLQTEERISQNGQKVKIWKEVAVACSKV
jgi:hypothetical protein